VSRKRWAEGGGGDGAPGGQASGVPISAGVAPGMDTRSVEASSGR